jgi:peptide deformylase
MVLRLALRVTARAAIASRSSSIALARALSTAAASLGRASAATTAPLHPPIRKLGDEILIKKSAPIVDVASPETVQARRELHAALAAFRAQQGFGRAIAAPQIGHSIRMIALNLGYTFTMHNPVLTNKSRSTFTMWDDCMSFEELFVRVSRHKHVDVSFTDSAGRRITWTTVPQHISELLQHEVDHLDGLTSFDRMDAGSGFCCNIQGVGDGPVSVVNKSLFEANKTKLLAQVDYSIAPTIGAKGPDPWLAQQMLTQPLAVD